MPPELQRRLKLSYRSETVLEDETATALGFDKAAACDLESVRRSAASAAYSITVAEIALSCAQGSVTPQR